MSLHPCYLVMRISGDVRAASLPKLLGALRPAFAPRDVAYVLGAGHEIVDVSSTQPPQPGTATLWTGETVEAGALMTRYTPTDEEQFLASFEQEVAKSDDSMFWMSMKGALRHRAAGADAPAWFGRWWSHENVLHELYTIRITCKPGEPRELEFIFPIVGYPLTTAALGHSEIVAGDPRTGQLNRDELLPIIARARDALGLAPAAARWCLDGDFGSSFPDDDRELEAWVRRMNA